MEPKYRKKNSENRREPHQHPGAIGDRSGGRSALAAVPGVRLVGTAEERAGVVSFVVEGVHPHDIGQILDQEGIAIRTGHHCCQPIMDRFQVPATARASLALYNTREDIDALVAGLYRVKEIFA